MTAGEIAALVTAAVSLMGAAAAYLHSRATAARLSSHLVRRGTVPNRGDQSCSGRNPLWPTTCAKLMAC